VPTLEQGRIIWAELPSSDGTQVKRRPAVVVTPTSEIASGKPFMVVAATTKFGDPLPLDHVLLPWHSAGKARSQLRQPTAAVCTWLFEIEDTDIHKFGGVLPSSVMLEIDKILKQRKSE
jgi:mRNA-degrading endonuclease toxin of MazEF toxin-antitoxin module